MGKQLWEAASKGRADEVRAIVQEWGAEGSVVNWANPDDGGWTPLYAAAAEGHHECLTLLLAAPGIAVNQRVTEEPHMNKTPLAIAEQWGQTQCAELLRKHGGSR